MKDKIVIRSSFVPLLEQKASLASVKIIEKVETGDDTVLVVSFRAPNLLFQLARYMFENSTAFVVAKRKTNDKRKIRTEN